MAAAVYNIEIDQGSRFQMIVTVRDSTNALVDLTGYEFAGKIKADVTTTAVAEFDYEILNQVSAKGQVRLYIPSTETAAIIVPPVRGEVRPTASFIYDIEYGPAAGEKERLLQGTATVSAEVTK